MINSKDIAIVFCGELSDKEEEQQQFLECLTKTREALPDSFFILSCSDKTQVPDTFKYDSIVRTVTPPTLTYPVDIFPHTTGRYGYNWHYKKGEFKSNHNRMIVKAKAGVNAVPSDIKYILKLRTDMFINNPSFLNLFEIYQDNRDSKYKVFSKRTLNSSLFAIDPLKWGLYSFHPSDWLNFGLREDIQYMWNIPLCPQVSKIEDPQMRRQVDSRIIPEMYSWVAVLNKKFNLFPDYIISHEPRKVDKLGQLNNNNKKKRINPLLEEPITQLSNNLMFNNFIPIDSSPINFYSVKKGVNWLSHNSLYTLATFTNEYNSKSKLNMV